MRYFKSYLFLGNGDHSVKQQELLKKVLESALETNAAIEQMGLQGTFFDKKDYKLLKREIEDAVKDMAAALIGRSIKLGRKLKYP